MLQCETPLVGGVQGSAFLPFRLFAARLSVPRKWPHFHPGREVVQPVIVYPLAAGMFGFNKQRYSPRPSGKKSGL